MPKRPVLFVGGPLDGTTEKIDEFQTSRTVWQEVPDDSGAPVEHERFHYRITDEEDGESVGRLVSDWDAQEYVAPQELEPGDPGYTPEWRRPWHQGWSRT